MTFPNSLRHITCSYCPPPNSDPHPNRADIDVATRIKDIERSYHARTSGEYPECEGELQLAISAYKMKSYEEWLSQGRDADERGENWNQVSVSKLLTSKL